jgi:hypothetical protein
MDKLHNEELHDFHCSPSTIRIMKTRRMRRAGHVARMGENRNAYRLLVGKPQGRRSLGRLRQVVICYRDVTLVILIVIPHYILR